MKNQAQGIGMPEEKEIDDLAPVALHDLVQHAIATACDNASPKERKKLGVEKSSTIETAIMREFLINLLRKQIEAIMKNKNMSPSDAAAQLYGSNNQFLPAAEAVVGKILEK